MEHIGKHMREDPKGSKRDRATRLAETRRTERGELMKFFMAKLNRSRGRDGLQALTMARMGRLLIAIPTQDLYYLQSVCEDAEKRAGSMDAFSKKFWWEIKPKKDQAGS